MAKRQLLSWNDWLEKVQEIANQSKFPFGYDWKLFKFWYVRGHDPETAVYKEDLMRHKNLCINCATKRIYCKGFCKIMSSETSEFSGTDYIVHCQGYIRNGGGT